jgi:putative endonuclease
MCPARREGASSDPRQRLGRVGEQLAAEHLQRRGFTVLERNYRTRWGELDLVAFDGQTLVFCEVKTRRRGRFGAPPLEAVRPHKRAQVRRMAGSWLHDRPDHPYASELRFDAIGITLDLAGRMVSLEHLEAAW